MAVPLADNPRIAHRRPIDRAAAGFLLVLMAVGCLALWIVVPALSLYAASQVTETLATHFLLALPLTILAVILFARGLFWVNRLYLRVTLASRPDEEDDWDEDLDQPRWARGPLEPMLIASLGIALASFVAWFFLLAENPALTP